MDLSEANQAWFWARVEKVGPDECWIWKGRSSHGYGGLSATILAHRFSLALHTDGDKPGMFALHSCDNPMCVNPHHLRWGTNSDNMRDRNERNPEWRAKNAARMAELGRKNLPLMVAKTKLLTHQQDKEVATMVKAGTKPKELAAQYGVPVNVIYKAVARCKESQPEQAVPVRSTEVQMAAQWFEKGGAQGGSTRHAGSVLIAHIAELERRLGLAMEWQPEAINCGIERTRLIHRVKELEQQSDTSGAQWQPIENAPRGVPIHTFGTYLPVHSKEFMTIVFRDDELSETSPYYTRRSQHEHEGMGGSYTRTHFVLRQELPPLPANPEESVG